MQPYRHAGIHWPTGGERPNRDYIINMPGVRQGITLMLADSARYHYNHTRQAGAVVVWRGLPRHDKRPADLNYNPSLVAESCMNLWDEQEHGDGVEFFTPLNELQFEEELGAPFPGFGAVASFLGSLRRILRDRLPENVKLVFPAWCPDQPYMDAPFDHFDEWAIEAMQWDVIGMHVYSHSNGNPEHYGAANVRRTHRVLRELLTSRFGEAGSTKPVGYFEWNANLTTDADEREMMEAAGEVCASDPHVMGYCYYIWQTNIHNHKMLEIWGNGPRFALFNDPPPLPNQQPPEPQEPEEPTPVPEKFPLPVDEHGNEWQASTQQVRDAIKAVAPELDPGDPANAELALLALAIGESGEHHQSQERWHIWTDHGKEAVRQRNLGYAAQVLGWGRNVGTIGTNDYSAGVFHQAMAWHEDFPGDALDPNDPWRWDVQLWLNFRARMIGDHGYATRYAMKQIRANYQNRPHDLQWVLERYNKPNGEVTAGVRANYARALDTARKILGSTNEPPIVVPPPPGPSGVIYEAFRDPAPAGTFSQQPAGVILHGSRSGRKGNPKEQEYRGTANYEVNNTVGVGWNATIGEGKVAVHLEPSEWGWNARAASRKYLGVEIAQATVDEAISDAQVDAFVDWFRTRVLPVWPNIPLYFPSHAEVERSGETGAIDGKSDVFPQGSAEMEELRGRIMARLTGDVPEPQPDPGTPADDDDDDRDDLISAVGYMGGDLADRLELARASMDDGIERPTSKMLKAELLANLEQAWSNIDRLYAEFGAIGDELRRVRKERLG